MKHNTPQYDIASIAGRFQISGCLVDAQLYGSGHVNDTFRITLEDSGQTRRYILQRINETIFKDPPSLMNNIIRVTSHIRDKLTQAGSQEIDRRVLTVILTHDGEGYFRDADGKYWRMYLFIENTQSYDFLTSPEQACEAARAFGQFQNALADLPEPKLSETIPNFHNTPMRFERFLRVLGEDPRNRADEAKNEIQFVLDHSGICDMLVKLAEQGEIPERVTHNDTKINNVLFDTQTQNGICVLDLDTVMPGLSLYDFGDMIRTATCRAAEDERDLTKIHVDISLFREIVRGYAGQSAALLNDVEKPLLGFSGKLITFEQMIRFLTDFLEGDVYYKVHRPGHNLDRTRTQRKLVESILEQEDKMNELTEQAWKDLG